MIFTIEDNMYELSDESFDFTFEDAKQFTNAAIDYCEEKKLNNREVLRYLMCIQCQTEALIRKQIDKLGEEKFISTVGAVKMEDDDEVI